MYESRNAECLNLQKKKRKSNSFWNIEKKRYKRQFTGQWGHIQYKAPVTASVLPHVLHSQHSPSDRPVLQQAIGNRDKLLYVYADMYFQLVNIYLSNTSFPKKKSFHRKILLHVMSNSLQRGRSMLQSLCPFPIVYQYIKICSNQE